MRRISAPYEGQWGKRTASLLPSPPAGGVLKIQRGVKASSALSVLPDDIWTQCGIQFRVESVAVVESADVELTTRVQNPSDVASGVDCDVGDGLFATSFANTVNTLAMPKLADPSLLNVVFNYRTSGHTCLFGSGDTTSCCDSQTFGSTIAIQVVAQTHGNCGIARPLRECLRKPRRSQSRSSRARPAPSRRSTCGS